MNRIACVVFIVFLFVVLSTNLHAQKVNTDTTHTTDSLPHERRTLQALAPVNVINFNNKKILFQSLLSDQSKNITVLDFWASWCVPCIADNSYLQEIKAGLSNQSVRFISISVDVSEAAWILRTTQLHTFKTAYQYRLDDPKHSPINNFFKLYTIPRYIVIDKTGKILEENFERPGVPAFQKKLEAYLKSYKQFNVK